MNPECLEYLSKEYQGGEYFIASEDRETYYAFKTKEQALAFIAEFRAGKRRLPGSTASWPRKDENPEEMGIRARLFEIWSMPEEDQAALKSEVEQLERKLKEVA